MSDFTDQPRPVRQGEELDCDRLAAFIRRELPDLAGELTVQQFPKGHSNLTYQLQIGDQQLVLRRPPLGAAIRTAHDMHREYAILRGLDGVYAQAPRPLLYCDDETVIGAPFYLMQRVEGVILRGVRPPEGLEIPAETMHGLCTSTIDNLVVLHAVDVKQANLDQLDRGPGYVKRQIRGWTERYFRAKTDELPQVERAAEWLEANLPHEDSSTHTLIHNDYKYDNLVLDPDDLTRIRAVLDWEMATVGDPLMDLGTTLGYWIDPEDPPEFKMLPLGPTLLPGNLDRRQVVERYAARSGRELSNPTFYFVYGLFKVAVIAQQIYKRFKEGKTSDQRFAAMIIGVRILGQTASRAIELDRIDRLG
jgi:aminoglycoside phosphotransferase (APT) family kinase protein